MAHDFEKFPGYEIISELGRGTTGVVYEVRDERLDRRLALKMLLPGSDPHGQRAKQFIRESQVLAALTREPDAIVPTIYAVAERDGRLFYVREFIEGTTMAATGESLKLRAGFRVLSSIADAIGRVHALGIAHRNLHPSNILVAASGSPKLIGFGRCALAGEASLLPGPSPVSVEVDIHALKQLLDWVCAVLDAPQPVRLAANQRLKSVTSPPALARVLREFGDEELPD